MKPKEIQELIDFIAQSGMDEVNIETENFKLSVKKNAFSQKPPVEAYNPVPQIAPPPVTQPATVQASPSSDSVPVKPVAATPETTNYITVKSPMIGTFYRTPNPSSPNFVNVGDTIATGQTLCIIEAMKLFNEIESEVSGKIVKILVENATPVEYDQPLFLVDPS